MVAGDRLQENPDANATEAIGRLPGVSVTRDAGEGSGIVVRGLASKYTSVTLNGVKMAATGADGRGTNISGISQYSLGGVEVYKAITADMDASSVAGTINLKLRETPSKIYANVMSTTGYNSLNKDFGNYKWLGEFGNRYFGDKLGLFASVTTEKVNRSAETTKSDFETKPPTDAIPQFNYLGKNTALNLNEKYKRRTSGMINLDYKLGSTTKLGLYGLYNRSNDQDKSQSKTYSAEGSGGINYGFKINDTRVNELIQSSLSGQTDLDFMTVEYGLTLSKANTNDPNERTWGFAAQNVQDLLTRTLDQDFRLTVQPREIPLLYNDNAANIDKFVMTTLGVQNEQLTDNNLDTYINLSIPLKITDDINAKFKTGYVYRKKDRLRDKNKGNSQVSVNQFLREDVANDLDFINRNSAGDIIAEGFQDGGTVNDFLNGEYNFGPTFSFDRLNDVTTSWLATSQYWYDQGDAVWKERYPGDKLGLNHDITTSTLNDQDIQETYNAGYVMAEFRVKDWLMFLPGIRYEKTHADMAGFASFQPTTAGPIFDPLPGTATTATRDNEFFLPMIHLRLSPSKSFYTHLSYTETLSRPTFDQISPTSWTNTGFAPFRFVTNNPNLAVEQWKSYDAQFTYHGEKISLVSVTGFYKKVNNQIWKRNYTRIKGDPILPPFADSDQVDVQRPENHPNEVTLKGVEFELQNSFGYLDNWFKYFTVSLNYTYTHSQTFYPTSRTEQIRIPDPNGGRPQVQIVRIDSSVAGPMLGQPKHIANASLGYNKKGLNVWGSFQFIDGILKSTDNKYSSLDKQKSKFYRFDVQISQKLSGVFKGFQIICNFANLNDFVESERFRGDSRALQQENYGWTAELGIRYQL